MDEGGFILQPSSFILRGATSRETRVDEHTPNGTTDPAPPPAAAPEPPAAPALRETRAGEPAPSLPEAEPARFGAWLARARERRHLSLDDVAHMTKIRRAILEALERDARRELPEKVFVMGYVRSVANAVGLDVDEALRRFQDSWPDDGPGVLPTGEGEPPPARSWAWVAPVGAAILFAAVAWFIVNLL